jgi:hypothetical protein
LIHPLQQYIYSSTILGGRILQIVTRSFFLGDIKIDSWCVVGPHPPTIHYTLHRFILKDPGLQSLGNPQKQGAIRDVMTNPKNTLELTRGW